MLLLGTFTFANNLMAVSVHQRAEWCFEEQGRCRGAVSGVGAAVGWRHTDLETRMISAT